MYVGNWAFSAIIFWKTYYLEDIMDVLIQMKRWQIIPHYTYQQKPIYGVLSTK